MNRSNRPRLAFCSHELSVSSVTRSFQPRRLMIAPAANGCKRLYDYLDDIVAAFVGDTGTMTCAYGVPFHITHGPPPFQSVG